MGRSGRCCDRCPVEWGQGDAGLGRFGSRAVSLTERSRVRGGVGRTLWDFVSHVSCFSAKLQVRKFRMGLDVEQNGHKNVNPMQQEAGIRRREQSTPTWTC